MTAPTLPDAVLFDMDGTLVDTEGLWLEAETEVMRRHGVSWTPADQAECLGGPLERAAAYMSGLAGGQPDPEAIAAELLAAIEGLFRRGTLAWQPGARELVVAVRDAGIPMALVSASWRCLVDAVVDGVVKDLGADPFGVTVAGDEVARSKPDPEPYLAAARALGVQSSRCVVIEDSPTGVASGEASGAVVVAIPHVVDISSGPRTVVVTSLRGVTLERLGAWSSDL